VRAEYRREYVGYDDAGSLPSGMSARFSSFFVGIIGGKF
jgi:hypothetical protein